MYVRPKLKDVCDIACAMDYNGALYLKLSDSGGFELLKKLEVGAYELVGKNLRQAVRNALDSAEKFLHDRRRERPAIKEAE